MNTNLDTDTNGNLQLFGVEPVDKPGGTITYSHLGVFVFQNKAAEHLKVTINTDPNSNNGVLESVIDGISESSGLKTIVNGKRIFASTPYRMEISGGPIDPVGGKFTLDVDLRPAFTDVDGNTYYKKTIITSTIPAQ